MSLFSDEHCNITGMSSKMLEVFENVEVITGYLSIEYWPLDTLCVFKYVYCFSQLPWGFLIGNWQVFVCYKTNPSPVF